MTDKKQEIGNTGRTESGSLVGKGGRPAGSKNKTTLFKEAMRDGFEDVLQTEGIKVFIATAQRAIGHAVKDKDGTPVLDSQGNQLYEGGSDTASKMIMDRIISVADATGNNGSGKTSVVINVQGMETNIDVIEGEVIDD